MQFSPIFLDAIDVRYPIQFRREIDPDPKESKIMGMLIRPINLLSI